MARQSQKTRAPQETAKAKEETGNGPAEDGTQDETLAAMMRANEVLFQGMTEMQRALLEFGNARLRQDLETQEALSQCRDLQEALRLQAEFAQKAFQQYSEETARLMQLSARIGRDCWGPFTEATRAGLQKTGTD